MANQRRRRQRSDEPEFDERVVEIVRTAKVLKGGRRFGFRVVVVVGDNRGRVGAATGKANEVPEAIRKAMERAKRQMVRVPMVGGTIPHEITVRHGGAHIMLRPAAPGTGVIAGHAARAVLEAAGVRNILTKNFGSTNVLNVTMATFKALRSLKDPEREARNRGKPVEEVAPFWSRPRRGTDGG
jgi:small subunit ribosomal protein S5